MAKSPLEFCQRARICPSAAPQHPPRSPAASSNSICEPGAWMSFQVFPDLDMGAKVIFLAQRLHRTLPGGGEGLLCCRAAPQQESAASKAPNLSPLLFLWEWDFAWNAALSGGQVGPWLLNIKYDPNQWFLCILFLWLCYL